MQENNGRSFLKNLEGISLSLENSHPQYVKAGFDIFNQTLSLFAQNIGEANIKVKYSNDTFDVIRVKVVSSIKPVSPVHVHQGAVIHFVYDEMSSNAIWESSDTKILTINHDGRATAIDVGTAIVANKGDVVLTSQVFVSKVT